MNDYRMALDLSLARQENYIQEDVGEAERFGVIGIW